MRTVQKYFSNLINQIREYPYKGKQLRKHSNILVLTHENILARTKSTRTLPHNELLIAQHALFLQWHCHFATSIKDAQHCEAES